MNTGQLAMPAAALAFGFKRAGVTFQLHHVIDEFDRDTKMQRSRSMPVPLFNEINNTRPKLNWMWSTHICLPVMLSLRESQ